MDEGLVVARIIEILRQLSDLSISKIRAIATEVSVDQAIELVDALVQLKGGQEHSPRLRGLIVEWLFAAGRISECVDAARELSVAGAPSPVSASAKVAEILALAVGEPVAGVDRAVQVLRTTRPESGPAVAVAAAAVLADACWQAGRLEDGLQWASRADEGAARIPGPFWRMYVRIGLANKLAAVGELGPAEELCREIQEELALVPCPGIAAGVALVRARILIHRGHWAKAHHVLRDEQVGQARSTGERMFLPPLLGCVAVADMYSGDTDGARSRIEAARSILGGRMALGDGAVGAQWVIVHDWVEILVRYAVDGAAAALGHYEASFGAAPARITGLFAQVTGAAGWIVRVAVHCGRTDVAQEAVNLAEDLSRGNPGLTHLALAADHARSLLVGDTLGLIRAANRQSHQWARARAASDLATAVDAAAATAPLEKSPRAEPVALPRPPATELAADDDLRTISTWAGLSEREQRIAQFVAQGLTNRQIATRSECSVHTVNYHLRSIFRKLGIRSRIEITHFLPARRPDEPVRDAGSGDRCHHDPVLRPIRRRPANVIVRPRRGADQVADPAPLVEPLT